MRVPTPFREEDAQSEVIGVVLMVALVVILAAVVGTFVFGLGGQVRDPAPQASITFAFDEDGSGDCSGHNDTGDTGALTITHDGGDTITAGRLTVHDDDGNAVEWTCDSFDSDGDVAAGSAESFTVDSDDTIRVVWESSGGGDTATLGKWTGSDA